MSTCLQPAAGKVGGSAMHGLQVWGACSAAAGAAGAAAPALDWVVPCWPASGPSTTTMRCCRPDGGSRSSLWMCARCSDDSCSAVVRCPPANRTFQRPCPAPLAITPYPRDFLCDPSYTDAPTLKLVWRPAIKGVEEAGEGRCTAVDGQLLAPASAASAGGGAASGGEGAGSSMLVRAAAASCSWSALSIASARVIDQQQCVLERPPAAKAQALPAVREQL